MNLLEHHILKIYGEVDITDKFTAQVGHPPMERLIDADMEIDCYGRKKRTKRTFLDSEWEKAKKDGFYLA